MEELLNNNLDITIAIPTYNGAERLPQVLERLLVQTGVELLNWEIIIIDNNSSDRTFEIITNYQKNAKFHCPLKYFWEPKQGIAFARQRCVIEARGQFIAFLDDDNLPESDWVLQAYNFGNEHPRAGAWSGKIHGGFEVNPPENFKRIEAFLAIREHGEEAHLFDADNLRLPPGAALVVRKQAWCECVPEKLMFQGRLGRLMVSGDDTEVLLYLYKAGWEIWYNPAMNIEHKIPHWRLEKNYLLRLALGCGLCTFQLRLINANNWQKPVILFRTILGNLRRIILHILKYKRGFQTDLIVRVELEFYLGSLLSPFYALIFYFAKLPIKNISFTND